jgi:L-2,4-diaminobutyrate decarboxylase
VTTERDPLAEARRRVANVYSPETFSRLAEAWSELLTRHLRSVTTSQERVLNWNDPPLNIEAAGAYLDAGEPQDGIDLARAERRFRELASEALARGQNLHDPRYIGHQVPPPSPIAGLFDSLGTVTNQVMAVYEMGPWATAVERALIQRWGEAIGYPSSTFAGLITSGGSLANLTALLTARNIALEGCFETGIRNGHRPALVVQADAHYCIARSAGILGLGTDSIIKAPLDDQRRMDPELLDRILRQLHEEGRKVIAVVACAGATPTGAFDPLEKIADICEQRSVWMHVDAAHGGGTAFSERYRHLLRGAGRADSVICDAHKMLFTPALCAFVFYKNREHRFDAFRQTAPYLFDPSNPGAAEYDCGLMTIECTKRAAAYGLWGLWSLCGSSLFGDLVDVTFQTTRDLFDMLRAADDFEPLHEPQSNILVFRYVPADLRDTDVETLGQFNRDVRKRLIHSGQFYITQTTLNGGGAMRCTLMNPLTERRELDGLLSAIRRIGREMLESPR